MNNPFTIVLRPKACKGAALWLLAVLFPVHELLAQSPEYSGSNRIYDAKQDSLYAYLLKPEFGRNKVYPKQYEQEILIALAHYPELKEVSIHFLIEDGKAAHSTRPMIGTLFGKKAKRVYYVFISSDMPDDLKPTLSANLTYNSRIGVMGHELAHIAWYESKNTFQLMGVSVAYLFKSYRENMEKDTDRSAIQHHLGYQLLSWSEQVHPSHIADGRGNQYLSPEEIKAEMGQQ